MERTPLLTPSRTVARVDCEPVPIAPKGRRWTLFVMLVGVLSLTGSMMVAAYTGGSSSRGGDTSTPTTSRPDRRAVAVAYVDVEGGVRPLYPAVPGRVVEANVPEGKEVESGTVLLRIDDALAQARLKEATLDFEAAKEKLKQAKTFIHQHKTKMATQEAAVEAAKKKLSASKALADKAKRFVEGGLSTVVSREDLDAANGAVDADKQLIKVEQGKLESIKALDPEAPIRLAQFEADAKKEQVEKADLGVRECKLVAPCKGVILRRLVNVGELLGQTPNRPAIEFCPSGDRIVRAEVEQEFARRLFIGQKAQITDDMTGIGEWHGEVTRISDWYTQRRAVLLEPMQFNDVRTLEVILRLQPDTKNPLRINQRVRVRLAGES